MPEVRAAAARCLAAVAHGQSLSRELPRAETRLKPQQRPLFRELCYGTLRQFHRLDGVVSQCLKKPMKDKDCDLHMLLCIGLYQLDAMRIPAHAAINTTVNATKTLKKDWARGMTNAVLRRYQREGEVLQKQLSPAQSVAHPQWLFDAITLAWPDQAETIFQANNSHPPLCLRNNQRQQSREAYLHQLSEAEIAAQACDFAENGIRLDKAVDVSKLPGFADGAVSVQDESAQLCAEILKPSDGMRVLDACAAPGGKTCHLLETADIELVALDIDDDRLGRVQENLDRLSLSADLVAGDAAEVEHWWDEQLFDQILLDAPCSATGVIRRNPDIKLHRRPEDIDALAQTQLKLLHALWPTLKSGGQLLYATCSILPRENREVIAQFLEQEPTALHTDIHADWGLSQKFGRQLLPENPEQGHGHDGFYYALLTKT